MSSRVVDPSTHIISFSNIWMLVMGRKEIVRACAMCNQEKGSRVWATDQIREATGNTLNIRDGGNLGGSVS